MSSTFRPSGQRAAEIAADVEAAVAAGRATPGTLLPPVRTLAADLGVAPGTVAGAYRLLAERGVVEGNRRAGTRVRPRPTPAPAPASLVPPGTRDLASGNPDGAFLPDAGDALRRTGARLSRPTLYGGSAVLPALEAYARRTFEADGLSPEGIAVTGGALDAVERALQVHLRAGMRVAVEDPGYGAVLDLLSALGLVADPVPVDEDGMDPAALRAAVARGAQAVIVTPRAQNPTGAALSPERAARLNEVIADAPGVLLVEDDHASQVAGPAAVSASRGIARAVVIRSCSKAFGPDLRVAVVGGDQETVAGVQRRQAVGAGWVSHLLQEVVVTIATQPDAQERVSAARASYARRRAALVSALVARGVSARARSGLNVWVPVREEGPVVAGMAARGWAVAPGARFRLASPPGVRITVARLQLEEIDTVADALAATMRSAGTTRTS